MEAGSTSKRRSRRGLVLGITVLASVVAFLAVFSIWAKRQALETDTWTETSTELLEDPEIREQLSNFLVDELFANVDVEAELSAKLPPQLQPLAGPVSGGVRQLADRTANEALQRPRVQKLWEDLNRNTHEHLIAVVESDSADEPVTLDLGQIVEQLGEQVGVNVSGKVPPDAGEIVILPADKLGTAQDVVNGMKNLAIALTILALVLFALAIYLAKGWRREALRGVGFAFILVGIAVLFARNLAGHAVVDSLASTAAVEPAVQDTWDIGTSLLADGGQATIFYGIMIVLGAWLAGPGGVASSVRRSITPVVQQRSTGYGALLVLLLLLFWWSPTEGFSRLPIALLIIALFVVGFEFLRRQAISDFPDETWEQTSARWRDGTRSLFQRR